MRFTLTDQNPTAPYRTGPRLVGEVNNFVFRVYGRGQWRLIRTPCCRGLFSNERAFGSREHLCCECEKPVPLSLVGGGLEAIDVLFADQEPLRATVWISALRDRLVKLATVDHEREPDRFAQLIRNMNGELT